MRLAQSYADHQSILKLDRIDHLVTAAGLSNSHSRARPRIPARCSSVQVKPTVDKEPSKTLSRQARRESPLNLSVSGLYLGSRPSRTTEKPLAASASCQPSSFHPAQKLGCPTAITLRYSDKMHSGVNGSGRRERSFMGSTCAACEEPLEHMLRGERILQLSCGHVSHEACFYEYIREFDVQTCPDCDKPLDLDAFRGGNVDFDSFNKLARNDQVLDLKARSPRTAPPPSARDPSAMPRSAVISENPLPPPTPATDDHLFQQTRPKEHQLNRHTNFSAPRLLQTHASPGGRSWQDRRPNSDVRNSFSTNAGDALRITERRHDYDVQCMEASATSPRHVMRSPIPAPTVTVRSEFPTLHKSRHQQSLTCLVTVEVVEGTLFSRPDARLQPSPIIEECSRPSSGHPTPPPESQPPTDSVHEDATLDEIKEDVFRRVENWHGLDLDRFGKLKLYGVIRVGKDGQTWQELECYLFSDMLICVKERKMPSIAKQQWDTADELKPSNRCTLKGSILVKRHLLRVETAPEDNVLTLHLSVVELPVFHLQFRERNQLETWRNVLLHINRPLPPTPKHSEPEHDPFGAEEDDFNPRSARRISSMRSSSFEASRSPVTAVTDYSTTRGVQDLHMGTSSMHAPLDVVIVVPVSSSMHGLKMDLLRDALRFFVSSLGERDRMGLVTFGAGSGGVPVVGMTTKKWHGWSGALDSLRPAHNKTVRADVLEGANVALDLLMQRKSSNLLTHVLLISDAPTSDHESVEFIVSRAEAAKISIHSFGLGTTHKPDTMVELSTRTQGSYFYVKDWMMLRDCLAGCLGSLQTSSHQKAKLRLRLPEGSPAKFTKISGALQVTKRANGREAEVSLGDLRFGDKRDVLVQLAIQPESDSPDSVPTDPWETIISGLEAIGPMESEDQRALSVEEIPLLQADLTWSDILTNGSTVQLSRPSLLAITMLPAKSRKNSHGGMPLSPPIPPHPSVVQRRMELLTSDMLSRALALVSRGQNDRAQHLLAETRSILKGLGKGGLPPLPSPPPSSALPPPPKPGDQPRRERLEPASDQAIPQQQSERRTPSPGRRNEASSPFKPAAGVDRNVMAALDHELETSLEWIPHPAVFARDARKSVLQAIGVISTQRGYTFRSPSEQLWASRIPGVRRLAERSLEWREADQATPDREDLVDYTT